MALTRISSYTLATNAVGDSALSATTVSAGTYGNGTNIPTFTVDDDGRLTAASNTSIANLSITTLTTSGNATIGGNLTVNGSVTTISTEAINLADNIVILNSNATGAASENAGFEIERGDDANVALRWNETSDNWELTTNGTNYYGILTTNSSITSGQLPTITSLGTVTSGTWTATNIGIAYGGTGASTEAAARTNLGVDDMTVDGGIVVFQGAGDAGDGGGGGGGTSSNSFATIAVAGQSNVVADSATDTLTIVAGTNITITTNATSDSITINASGSGVGAGSYNDLTDKPSLFSGSYNDLTSKPTTVSSFTNDAGYLTGVTNITGNAATATTLQNARLINGVSFNGSADVTVHTAGTGISVSGTTVTNTGVTSNVAGTGISVSSATGAVTITNSGILSITGTAPVSASTISGATTISMAAATASVNGYMTSTYASKLDGIASGATANTGTVTSVGGTGTVSGLTLSGTVSTTGNLTLGGTLSVDNSNTTATNANTASAIVARDASGNFTAGTITATLTGNASTVTNGVYTNGSYSNPTWITELAYSKLTGTPTLATVATSGSYTDLTNKPTSAFSNQYIVSGTTTNATETEIFVNGVASTRIAVALNTAVYYTFDIVGRRTDTSGDYAAFYVKGLASNIAGTTSDIGSVYEVVIARTDTSFQVDVRADNTTDTINVYVTGSTGKTISWKCSVTTTEV